MRGMVEAPGRFRRVNIIVHELEVQLQSSVLPLNKVFYSVFACCGGLENWERSCRFSAGKDYALIQNRFNGNATRALFPH